MSMTTQDWRWVESRRDFPKPRKPTDPMAYLAVLVILAAIATLMTIFLSIGSVRGHMPDRPHTNPTAFTPDE